MTTSAHKPQTSDSISQTKVGKVNKTSKTNKASLVNKTNKASQPTKTTKTTLIKEQTLKKTKKQIGLELLKRSQGASLTEIQKALGWQMHSVRGFLAGTAKKEQGFNLNSEKTESQLRRYRLTVMES